MIAGPLKSQTKVLQSTFPHSWGLLASVNQRNVALEIKATEVSRVIAISGHEDTMFQSSGLPTVAIQHFSKLHENLLLPSLR